MYPSPSPNTMSIPGDGSGNAYFSHSQSSSGQQQQQQPPSGLPNNDELQLTAQLSRGIVPNMNTGGPGGGLPEGQDLRGNVIQYDHPQSHNIHLQGSSGGMGQMGESYGGPDASNRKRSKVSRACDECRRKKIRCDATEESGDQQCSSCKRVGTHCQFSRVPMKRGPSKGYIKELADRLNTLEGAMQAGEIPVQPPYLHSDSPLQRRGSEEFSPPPNTDGMLRKRTYSSVSGDFGPQFMPQRPASGWTSQESPRQLPPPPSAFAPSSGQSPAAHAFREPNYSPNGLQPAAQWRVAPEPLHRQGSSLENIPPEEQKLPDRIGDWDESIVDGYYSCIHQTYPILSHAKTRLSSRLASCPSPLRDAFYESLHAAVRSFPTAGGPLPEQQNTQRAAQFIAASSQAGRTFGTNLIYLQIMLLMAIEADNRDPASVKSQSGQPQSMWLGSAVGLAYSMKLHTRNANSQHPEHDPDSEDKLARRLWWSLIIMDRWHAASTSSPLLIPDTTVVVHPDDQALLGENIYQLARLSIVLGHFTLIPIDLPTPSVPSVTVLSTLLRGELERLRESFPPSLFPPSQSPLIHLCYWYLRILVAMRLPESEPQDLLDPAMNVVTQLQNNTGLISPLTHHATALAAAALIALVGDEHTKQEAETGLDSLLESRIAPSGWDASIRTLIINNQNPGPSTGAGGAVGAKQSTSQSQHAAIQGLQRLADLATAGDEGRADGSTSEERKESTGGQIFQRFQDLQEIVRVGYLSKLGAGDAAR